MSITTSGIGRVSLRPLKAEGYLGRIQQSLVAYIEAAGLGVGDRLPNERTLAAQLGVSRPTIREALQTWQAMDLVETRMGSGTYLRQEIRAGALHVPVTIDLDREAVLHSLELRRAIETDAARLAVRRGTPEQVDELGRALETMETVYTVHGFAIREDRAFHEALYVASSNPLYLQIFRQLITRVSDRFNASEENPFVTEPFADASQPDHRDLYEALVARDEGRAVAAVTRILDFVEEELRRDR